MSTAKSTLKWLNFHPFLMHENCICLFLLKVTVQARGSSTIKAKIIRSSFFFFCTLFKEKNLFGWWQGLMHMHGSPYSVLFPLYGSTIQNHSGDMACVLLGPELSFCDYNTLITNSQSALTPAVHWNPLLQHTSNTFTLLLACTLLVVTYHNA